MLRHLTHLHSNNSDYSAHVGLLKQSSVKQQSKERIFWEHPLCFHDKLYFKGIKGIELVGRYIHL